MYDSLGLVKASIYKLICFFSAKLCTAQCSGWFYTTN